MIDPRLAIIDERLKKIKRIISVGSGKGGVGKSMVSSALALALSKKYKVGLLDLDFYGPSSHLILNAGNLYPEEKNGILPPKINKIKFMSIIYYTKDNPSPFKGADISNAIIELLAITIWHNLDFLIIDMPPGIGEEVLNVIHFMKKNEFIIVTTPSKLSWETVRKLLLLLKEIGVPIIGVVENMKFEKNDFIKNETEKFGIPYLGEIYFDAGIEKSIGNTSMLMNTNFGKKIEEIAESIANKGSIKHGLIRHSKSFK
ncbi:MAG: P-loop NTPase [Thermoplasmata archaeon]|nr:P-loop NTPase [Thermoplasmata archaeon]